VKGFTLVEVLIAMALVAVAGTALLELTNISGLAVREARVQTIETFTAASKIAELRATGAWLAGGSIAAPVSGYSDFVSITGEPVSAADEAAFERRWQIAPAPFDPLNAVVMQVVATRRARPSAHGVHLVALMTRASR